MTYSPNRSEVNIAAVGGKCKRKIDLRTHGGVALTKTGADTKVLRHMGSSCSIIVLF